MAQEMMHGELSSPAPIVRLIASQIGVTISDLEMPIDDNTKAGLAFSAKHNTSEVWNIVLKAATAMALSDKDVSTVLGIDSRRVSEARLGYPERPLSLTELGRFADLLGLQLDELLSHDDTERS